MSDTVLHGRRGQAVVGMASTISLRRVQVHGFVGGLQLADAVVRVDRCHLSHFFNFPSPLWSSRTDDNSSSSTCRLSTDSGVVHDDDDGDSTCPPPSLGADVPEQIPYVDNDNDALYVTGGDLQLRSTVVLGAGDDCLDSGTGAGGLVDVTGCWIEACQHEGIALSNNCLLYTSPSPRDRG